MSNPKRKYYSLSKRADVIDQKIQKENLSPAQIKILFHLWEITRLLALQCSALKSPCLPGGRRRVSFTDLENHFSQCKNET